jgi:hypothetical protein
MFGGNSNWRGPVWFPVNYFLLTALKRYRMAFGDDFKVEFPAGSGAMKTLGEVIDGIAGRLTSIFTRNAAGKRPVFGDVDLFNKDPHWRDLIPFYEYFHGDTGRGLGASHQTGWTGLIAVIIQEQSEDSRPTGWLTAVAQEQGPEPRNVPSLVERLPGAMVRRSRPAP